MTDQEKKNREQLKEVLREVLAEEIIPRLKNQETNQEKMQKNVSELKTDVSELKTDVSELKTDVSQLKTDVSKLKKNVSELKKENVRIRITQEKMKDSNLAIRRDIFDIRRGETQLQMSMSRLTEVVVDAKDTLDSHIVTTVEEHEEAMATIGYYAENKADKEAVQKHAVRISRLEEQMAK